MLWRISTTADLIRSTRRRRRLSQRALALRAGTTQAWISELERGLAQPTVEMLRRLMLVMGEELVVTHRPLRGHGAHDPVAAAHTLRQTPAERVEDALRWMALDL